MKILIEISHPAHVHYFRNFIKLMKNNGHALIIVAKDKEVTFKLLDLYNINYYSLGKSKNNIFSKVIGLLIDDIKLLKHSFKVRPDIYLSFSSPYVGHIAMLMNKPHIVFDDTEHATLEHIMYKPFASKIITPKSFLKNLGKKHFKFNSIFELCYLHPNYFKEDLSILKKVNIKIDEKFVILRFISWDAIHDKGQEGLSVDMKRRVIKELSKYAKVLITSECELPDEFKKYQINIKPNQIHSLMFYADLFFGESGTMAVEAALLGTPSVRVSTLAPYLGNFRELQDTYDLLYFFSSANKGLEKSIELIKDENSKKKWIEKKNKFINDKIDTTSFMIDLIENYHNLKQEKSSFN